MRSIENNILLYFEAYEKIFDIVRLVDPVEKKVIKMKGVDDSPDYVHCYSVFQISDECRKCIGMNALSDGKTLIKIQHSSNKMYLMFTCPLKIEGKTLVLELIKNITDNLVFEIITHGHELQNIGQDLNNLILKDTLINIYNRRYIDQMLPVEMASSTKLHPVSIAMIDVDHFKFINDTYGHNAGDMVMRILGQTITKLIRDDMDWAARYGGDEILICFTSANNRQAYKAVERIRKAVEKKKIKFEDKEIKFTISAGIYTYKGGNLSADDMIKYADQKLYEAKNRGRNMVLADK